MKKNIISKLLMMVALAMVSMTFTACGGDDEDDNGNNITDTAIGVHRIDVQFNDNVVGCDVANYFYALKADASYANIYENGK